MLDLVEFAKELTRQDQVKRDFLMDTRLMTLDADRENITLSLKGDKATNVFQVNGLMHDQIGQALNIPAKYYDLMKEQQPELLAENVNTWFHNKPSERMVRTLDGSARAFLSNRYRRLDNYQIASAVLPVIQQMPDAKIESMDITDTKMYLKMVNPRLETEISKGDIVQSGFMISNSEVGLGSVAVMPLILRLVCTNGMVVNDAGQRKYHIGRANQSDSNSELFRDETLEADDRAFMMKVQDTVRAAVDEAQFAKVVKIMRESKDAKITTSDIPHMIELTGKTFNLSKEEGGGILDNLIRGGDFSLYGLANAVTRHSQDVKSYDRATELESIGFDVISMDRGTWNTLNDVHEGRK
jgi:hypothetical protein